MEGRAMEVRGERGDGGVNMRTNQQSTTRDYDGVTMGGQRQPGYWRSLRLLSYTTINCW
jgi:hypothetical protein